jgi:hypothetical protein
LKDKILSIEAKKPFLILENSLSGNECANQPVEPKNIVVPQRRNGTNVTQLPRVLAHLEDDRTLQHICKPIVKSIYAFWQGYTELPQEIFPLWSCHKDSIEERRN